jgi:hypothetical protein
MSSLCSLRRALPPLLPHPLALQTILYSPRQVEAARFRRDLGALAVLPLLHSFSEEMNPM